MEKHLSNLEHTINMYKSTLDSHLQQQENNKKKQLSDRLKRENFMREFRVFRKDLHAYRALIKPMFDKAQIDIRIETREISNYILSKETFYEDYILFAITSKKIHADLRWKTCGFFAFCGDYKKNQVDIYQFEPEKNPDKRDEYFEKRIKFKEYARHIADDYIDKFDMEEMIPYIESYITEELKHLSALIKKS